MTKKLSALLLALVITNTVLVFTVVWPKPPTHEFFNLSTEGVMGFARVDRRSGEMCLWHIDDPQWQCDWGVE